MAIWHRTDNWLKGIGEADHPNHMIKGCVGLLTADKIQQAFDICYGKDRFIAKNHGNIVSVWSGPGYIAEMRAFALAARSEGLDEQANMLEQFALTFELTGQFAIVE